MTLPRASRAPEPVPEALKRMRWIATGLLVLMAAIFIATRAFDPRLPAIGFVRAFAEAAMVGGLADWFAVTALFRHPLGLPIPHTAIIPRNKDRIGDTLAAFLRDNFLIPHVVARRMRGVDIASAIGRWMAEPAHTHGRVRRGAARLAANMLESLDQERLGSMVRGALANRLRAFDIAPMLGQTLSAAIAENRHVPLIDAIVHWAARTLEANEDLIRAMVHKRAGAIMRFTGLDATLANSILNGLHKMMAEMAEDPDHPLRSKAEEAIRQLAIDLRTSPEMQARVDRIKSELLDNPALTQWWQGVWDQMRSGMLRMARDPDRLMSGAFGDAVRQLGRTLQSDPRLATTINRFVRRAAVGMAADYGDGIVRLVSETVRGWDAQTITRRLENAVGRDLQYIRVNGTLVGGLVGLVIHAADVLL